VAESDRSPAHALARLTEVSRALTYAASIDEVLDITVDCAAGLLDAPRVVLMLRDDDQLLRIRAARGLDPSTIDRFGEPMDETLVQRLNQVLGPAAEDRFLGVPLVVRGGVTGLLAVLRSGRHALDDRDEWLLSALADQAAVALENARSESSRSALLERVEELQRIGSQREDALRMVGHDLRSPLNALLGYVHLLEKGAYGPVSEGQRGALDRLTAIGRHLESLVSNVLEMGRLAAGTLVLELDDIHVRPVLDSARAVVELQAEEAGVRLTIEDLADDLCARASQDRLRQVLVQLLDNAIKYSPEGGTVRVTAGVESNGERRCVVIRVSDEGPGVPPEDSVAIFEPYRQLDDGIAAGGIGLGLAIARALVDRMGGGLTLDDPDSAPGATFAVRLEASSC
jgi:sigma-B regulation protein RsbU (phosphoserine phosphatase)